MVNACNFIELKKLIKMSHIITVESSRQDE